MDPLLLAKLQARFKPRNTPRRQSRTTSQPTKYRPTKKASHHFQTIPDALLDRLEEQDRLMKRYNEARRLKIAKATVEHVTFARWLRFLSKEITQAVSTPPGVLDVDVADVITQLQLHELPHQIRFLALEELGDMIRAVNKRCHDAPDDCLPWELPRLAVYTLTEAKTALGLT